MGHLGARLMEDGHVITIALADYYTFLHAPHVIDELGATGAQVKHQKENFFLWQGDEPGDLEDLQASLAAWEEANCTDRTLAEIERTNNFVFSDEREYFALQLDEGWRRRILRDSIDWVEALFDNNRPDVVMSIDNCTLVNNLAFTIAKNRSIPFLTCKNTRIKDRWNIRQDFCLGVGEETSSGVAMAYSSGDWGEEVQKFRQWFESQGRGAYLAPAHVAKKPGKYAALATFSKDILNLLSKVKPRIGESKRLKHLGVRRLEQDFFRLSIFELRAITQRFASAFGFHAFSRLRNLEGQKYFFWALHYRPEGSVLVQGLGLDEIEYLERCSRSLPDGALLYVKEHPFMFGYRSKDFYKRIQSLPGVKLIAPWHETMQLILDSNGVVGVAGTVLLEAEIAGKPAWAMGKPEFVDYLTGSGSDELESFLRRASSNQGYSRNASRINEYLAYVFSSSDQDDFWLRDSEVPIEKQNLNQAVGRMRQAIESTFLNQKI